VDQGAILIQKRCAVESTDTADSLKARVQALEGVAFVEAIRLFQQGRLVAASSKGATYSQAGVNMERGDLLVEKIKPFAKATARSGADSELGGFGALFDLAAAGYDSKETLLVSGTDGVGTKLLLAQQAKKHNTIGIDLVAMCVNDVLAQGAEPLFFLDYFATGKLQVEEAASVIQGIALGCKESGCALVGGETAEMPGMYSPGHYDLAGFAVGAVRRSQVLPRYKDISADTDIAIGLSSSGIHSNGYSLVRHLINQHNFDIMAPAPYAPGSSRPLVDDLLAPTKLYIKAVLPLMKRGLIKAAAHITGGGLTENIPRVIPDNVIVELDASTWNMPPVMRWLACDLGHMEHREILRTFNCGLGMVLIVDKAVAQEVLTFLHSAEGASPDACIVGSVKSRQGDAEQVHVLNVDALLKSK
jgi:phosphoribosylaminoimidazole synthetase